ncbi:MAG TPA: O-antigen ligase family protein [bacterium]
MRPGWLDRLRRGSLLATVLLYSAGYGVWGLLLLLVTTIIEAGITRRLPWTRNRLDLFLAAFLGAFLISGLFSPYRPLAVGLIGLGSLTIYLAFGATATMVTRDPSFLRPLAIAWVAGALGAGLWGVMLHRTTGQPAFTPVLGQNALGTTLLIATILALGLVLELRGRRRYLAAATGIALLTGLVLTYTRGAWLGALVGGALVLGLSGVRRLVVGIMAVTLIVVLSLAIFGSERGALISRAASIADLSANKARLYIIRASLAIFITHPLSGTGLGTFSLAYPAFRLPDDPNTLPMPFAHNIFANMAAEGGVVGFTTFGAIVVAGILGGWRWYHAVRREPQHTTAAVYLSTFIGAIVHQLFDGTLLSIHLGLGMWMLLAVLGVGWTRVSGPPQGRWTSV